MYVGGLVWALDWCPRVHQRPDCDINVQFIAVAAHPPGSSYHKVGVPLTGRGVIQIWVLLNASVKDNDVISLVKEKSTKNSRSNEATRLKTTQQKRPRGRPRKNPINESVDLDGNNQHLQVQSVQFPEDSSKLLCTNGILQDTLELVAMEDTDRNVKSSKPKKPRGRPKKQRPKESIDNLDNNKHLESVSNVDGNNQYPKPLFVKFPQDSSKLLAVDEISLETPESVSNEDVDSNYSDLGAGVSPDDQQQNHKGSDAEVLKLSEPHEPRRHRKKPTDEAADNSNCSLQHVKPLVQLADDSSKVHPEGGIPSKTHKLVTEKDCGRNQKGYNKGYSEKPVLTASDSRLAKCKLRLKNQVNGIDTLPSQKCGTSRLNSDTSSCCGLDSMKSIENKANPVPLNTDPESCFVSEDVALPRLVMCLAHNGKVAWDLKWRPLDTYANCKHRMGYLAVLLGDGALEVWEVPFPRATEMMFSACQKEGTDPRFIKLEPVFRCSQLKCGDRQSIPLTVEWSTSSPHDLILAGCHDGVVALWKFSANGPVRDTRPLLCFSADTVPIRALAWAPAVSDAESANIIVTAGHKGAKFWDIRDPFRPLWDVNPVQRIIYSLDWLPDPRCIVLSFDDGEIRIISLLKAASDVPVTGTTFTGTQLQGLHSYHCSSSSIWSVHVSRLTGMVAYCCSDGTVLRFQLTTKAVEKDPRRNREPHYLCGSLTMEGSDLTVFSPLPDVPFPIKKSSNEWGDTPRSRRGFLSISNQEKRARGHLAKCQTPEEQPLALCEGNDPGSNSEVDDHASKAKGVGRKRPKTDEVPECGNVEKEAFPPKIIAMHCVRWNMNKGSERWLCYGGSGGIVRCQEINSNPPTTG